MDNQCLSFSCAYFSFENPDEGSAAELDLDMLGVGESEHYTVFLPAGSAIQLEEQTSQSFQLHNLPEGKVEFIIRGGWEREADDYLLN